MACLASAQRVLGLASTASRGGVGLRRPRLPRAAGAAEAGTANQNGLPVGSASPLIEWCPAERPAVLFVSVHDAGRSQMAAAMLRDKAGDAVDVFTAGTEPLPAVDPTVAAAMEEIGIPIENAPKVLTDEAVKRATVVATMGCGEACPFYPGSGETLIGKQYVDFSHPDPVGQPLAQVREIRDEIRAQIDSLFDYSCL